MSTQFNDKDRPEESDLDAGDATTADSAATGERSGGASRGGGEKAQQAARREDEARYLAALAAPPPLVDPLQQISIACRTPEPAFYLPYKRAIESAYRAAHGRIPGSNRTTRLRKKRRDALNRWASRRSDH